MKENNRQQDMSRRSFLKRMGMAGMAMSGASLFGCSEGTKQGGATSGNSVGEAEKGEMTYRINPSTGDKVSLLGYGCMRWPMKKDENGKDIVDQEKVNELVDFAIEHGV